MSNVERAKGAWIVTGAGSGFGREMARRLSARGEALSLWDRDAKGLEGTRALLRANERAHLAVVDVREPDEVRNAVEEARAALGPLAHAVHCAGILRIGAAATMEPREYRAMIEVNYLGSVHVTLALLDDLKRAAANGKRAQLVLVSSIAGLRAAPELAGYSASKFAVLGFAQALRDELASTSVDIRVLCPPPGDTPMVQNLPYTPKVYELAPPLSAEAVVEGALSALDGDDFVMLVDTRSRAYSMANRLIPRLLDRIIHRSYRS